MLVTWGLYPLVLVAVGAGWGALAERAAETRLPGPLLVPVGLAAVVVVGGLLTITPSSAPAAVPVCGLGAVAGLLWQRPWRRLRGASAVWTALAALGVLLCYGAPVILSGQSTFLGYLRLDDTATWFAIVDNTLTHGRSLAGVPDSTYRVVLNADVGSWYPLGAYMILGVTRPLVGTDVAWVFQPYLACCGAALALCVCALAQPLVRSPARRAVAALIAAQPALLYGFSLWGGIKELTAAWLVALLAALLAPMLAARPRRARELVAPAIATAALANTLSFGAAAWLLPALGLPAVLWLRGWRAARRESREKLVRAGRGARRRLERRLRMESGRVRPGGALLVTGVPLVAAIPTWLLADRFFSGDFWLFSSSHGNGPFKLNNLYHPLSGFELSGIWITGDFRLGVDTLPTVPLIAAAIAVAVVTVTVCVRRRELGIPAYLLTAVLACAGLYAIGTTPWVIGKGMALSSPAIVAAAAVGAAMLWQRHRLGVVLVVLLGAGVLGSNVLAYGEATLAPRDRLVELQHIGSLVAGHGPTLVDDFDFYADRHFLRAGAPVEPGEARDIPLSTNGGVLLIKYSYADLDAFPLATLERYPSIVTRNSPVVSRPPSNYKLVWEGRYYELWQRPSHLSFRIVTHIPLGDQSKLPYCGNTQIGGPALPLCSVAPAGVAPCATVRALGRFAHHLGGWLATYERPDPIVARGDQVQWPASWRDDPASGTLTPTAPGTALGHIRLVVDQPYELWLGGSFARGFAVSVDGARVGRVRDEIFDLDGYAPIARLPLTRGVHTVALSYPRADLTPGSADNEFTSLSQIVFEPLPRPGPEPVTVPATQARSLCGRSLDWIEVVAPAPGG